MGGASVSKHLFLTLLLALSLVGMAHPYQPPNPNGADNGVPCDPSDTGFCKSGLCDGVCVACYGMNAHCGNSNQCCGAASNVTCGAKTGYVGTVCRDPAANVGGGNWSDSLPVWMALSLGICGAFLGLAYMASQLFQIGVLEAWVKIEVGELMTSIAIAVLCVALIASVNASAGFLVGENTDIRGASAGFLQKMYSDGKELYLATGEVYFNLAKTASLSYSASFSAIYVSIGYSAAPAQGMSPLVAEVGQGMDTVANFMLLAASQEAFLNFFTSAATVMLPVGIFLRSFSFTRKVGGVVLAAVIASSVIYPAGLLVSKHIYDTFQPDFHSGIAGFQEVKQAKNPPASSVVCSPYMQTFVQSPLPFLGGEIGWWVVVATPICIIIAAASLGSGFIPCMVAAYQVIGFIFMIIKALFPVILYVAVLCSIEFGLTPSILMSGYYEPIRDYVLPTVMKFSVLSLVAFLIPIIITLTLLRSLTVAFGGEPQLYGLSKLV